MSEATKHEIEFAPGRVLTLDEGAVVREADRIARRAWARLFAKRPDLPVPRGFAPPP